MVLVVKFDFSTGIFPEKDFIPGFHAQRNHLAVVVSSRTHGNHPTLLWFFLSSVRNDDTALGFSLFLDSFNDHPIM